MCGASSPAEGRTHTEGDGLIYVADGFHVQKNEGRWGEDWNGEWINLRDARLDSLGARLNFDGQSAAGSREKKGSRMEQEES